MSHYKPYPAYKDSGVEWLGMVPEHWDVRKLKWLASLQSGDFITGETIEEEGEYPVYGGNGLRGYCAAFTHEGAYALVGRQGALCGNINYADGKFWASEHAVVVSPYVPTTVRWLGELLRAMNLGQYSISSAQPGLAVERIIDLFLPVPPESERQIIAVYMDRETARIDALIEKKSRFIELLREKRQALITHAVTRGLDSSAKMKYSGVEWLGEVPEHWDVLSFQRCVRIAEGQVDPEESPYREMVLLAPNHIESGSGHLLYTETAEEQNAESGKYLCNKGDVVYSKIRPALRKVCIAPDLSLCSADMYPMQGYSGMSNQFLFWFLLSEPFSAFAVLEADRVAMPKINRESLNSVQLPRPPLNEQIEIVVWVEQATARLDNLRAKTERSIELLKERRAALITAAVTGQLDLREAE